MKKLPLASAVLSLLSFAALAGCATTEPGGGSMMNRSMTAPQGKGLRGFSANGVERSPSSAGVCPAGTHPGEPGQDGSVPCVQD